MKKLSSKQIQMLRNLSIGQERASFFSDELRVTPKEQSDLVELGLITKKDVPAPDFVVYEITDLGKKYVHQTN